MGMDIALTGHRIGLNEFQNFGRGGTWIRIGTGKTGVDSSQRQSLVSEKKFFSFHIDLGYMRLIAALFAKPHTRHKPYSCVRKAETIVRFNEKIQLLRLNIIN